MQCEFVAAEAETVEAAVAVSRRARGAAGFLADMVAIDRSARKAMVILN